ncbi:hypothetical protein PQE10_gp56 [Arthrobacter phage Tbone]|uniref:Uncharacterized protein n=1 Tax=Arthrobacter phage Tbone TaxID=2790983 RepID=A0A7T3N190_9CAUD|nr:hypothetical protein PQE10_gp56 [Arthrobacter phage Tbone]QPX62387.1 hypothetical protein SEA_TBONE_56 [Arthrobacter phage Tbone]
MAELRYTDAEGETFVASRDEGLVTLKVFAPEEKGGGLLKEVLFYTAEVDKIAALLIRATYS